MIEAVSVRVITASDDTDDCAPAVIEALLLTDADTCADIAADDVTLDAPV